MTAVRGRRATELSETAVASDSGHMLLFLLDPRRCGGRPATAANDGGGGGGNGGGGGGGPHVALALVGLVLYEAGSLEVLLQVAGHITRVI